MKVDLHIHTIASDGCWTPAELIDEIRSAGVSIFAAADHDSVGSVKVLSELTGGTGLHCIGGVEITSKLDNHVCHILGYGIDPDNPGMAGLCNDNTRRMQEVNIEQVKELKAKGIDIDAGEFSRYSFDRRRGGGAVMNFLVDKGFFKTFEEALPFVLKNVTWNKADYPSPVEAVMAIKNAGGKAVLAHPGSSLYGYSLSDREIDCIVDAGVDGLECFTNYHNEEMTGRFIEYCRKRELLITAGSDCHGPLLKNRQLGKPAAPFEDLNLTGIWP